MYKQWNWILKFCHEEHKAINTLLFSSRCNLYIKAKELRQKKRVWISISKNWSIEQNVWNWFLLTFWRWLVTLPIKDFTVRKRLNQRLRQFLFCFIPEYSTFFLGGGRISCGGINHFYVCWCMMKIKKIMVCVLLVCKNKR